MLGETFAHPLYFGLKAAKKILAIIKKKHNLKIKLNKLNKEIEQIDKIIKTDSNLMNYKKTLR